MSDSRRDDGSRGRFVVYALIDPRDGRIRYVGKTGNLKKRLAVTWCARSREDVGGSKAKRAWLLELDAAGLRPSVRVLESSDDFAAIGEAEERWIAKGRAEAWGLTNCHVKTSGTVPRDVRALQPTDPDPQTGLIGGAA